VEAIFAGPEGMRFAVLIEDKIKAEFQPNQMEDYFKRGDRGKSERKWDDFAVIAFAPGYRNFPPQTCAGAMTITFEDAVEQLKGESTGDPRLAYRIEFIQRAARPKTIVARDASEMETKWWSAVNELISANFGNFLPPQSPTGDSYVCPRWTGQPSYLRLDIKGHVGEVLLALKGFNEFAARKLLECANADGLEVVKKSGWKDFGLRVTGGFASYAVGDDLSKAALGILGAYAGARRLYDFWNLNYTEFERAASA
jgi:hypothetical protein